MHIFVNMSRFAPNLTGNKEFEWQIGCLWFRLLWIATHPLDARNDGVTNKYGSPRTLRVLAMTKIKEGPIYILS